jgi:flagellar protein FliO/FliZ
MPRSITPTRATVKVAMLAFGCALLAPGELLSPAGASAAGVIAKSSAEHKSLNLGSTSSSPAASGTGGASLVRTIVGLAIVIAVVWGLSWVLRQVKSGREAKAAGLGLASLATLPLGSGRSLQLVRAGSDYVLLGVAEQGVIPIHRYSEQQARDAGLLQLSAGNPMLADQPPAGGPTGIPGQTPGTAIDRLRSWTVRP